MNDVYLEPCWDNYSCRLLLTSVAYQTVKTQVIKTLKGFLNHEHLLQIEAEFKTVM